MMMMLPLMSLVLRFLSIFINPRPLYLIIFMMMPFTMLLIFAVSMMLAIIMVMVSMMMSPVFLILIMMALVVVPSFTVLSRAAVATPTVTILASRLVMIVMLFLFMVFLTLDDFDSKFLKLVESVYFLIFMCRLVHHWI